MKRKAEDSPLSPNMEFVFTGSRLNKIINEITNVARDLRLVVHLLAGTVLSLSERNTLGVSCATEPTIRP